MQLTYCCALTSCQVHHPPASCCLSPLPTPQVERPEQYGFSPDQLLVSIVYFCVRLAEQPAFVAAVSAVSLLR